MSTQRQDAEDSSIVDWKYKLGIIVPSWNTTMEYESWRMAPKGVSIHISRIAHPESSDETMLRMVREAPIAAELLAHAQVNAICFGCTGASFQRPGLDREIIGTIETRTKIPVTTASSAIVDALNHLEIKTVAFGTPYTERINTMLTKFLEYSGFRVVSQKGLNVKCSSFLPPESAYELALDVNCKDADVVLISCTNYRSMEVIERAERKLGKPVVSSNSAAMWKLLRLAGVDEKIEGLGRLFR